MSETVRVRQQACDLPAIRAYFSQALTDREQHECDREGTDLCLLRLPDHGMQAGKGLLVLQNLALLRPCQGLQLLQLSKLTLLRNLHAERPICVCDSKALRCDNCPVL